MTKGIDVSKWQGVIDWQAVKAAGCDFAILRAGLGNRASQRDVTFDQNYNGAKAAGIPVGCYWYSYADGVQDAKAEAAACLEVIKGKQFEFPVYYDLEDKTTAVLGKVINTQMVKAFCGALEKAGYFAGLYSYTSYMRSYLDWKELAKLYTIWLADYRTIYDKEIPRDMHQYTSSGAWNGINGRVDTNNCIKDFPSIIKAAGLNGYTKPNNGHLYDIAVLGVSNGDANKICELCDELQLNYTKVEE